MGEGALVAPQANAMAAVIQPLMEGGTTPWVLYFIGAVLALVLTSIGVPALAFSLGMFIPMELNAPLVVGGLVAWYVSTRSKDAAVNKARLDRGTLIASGFIAGGALMGVGLGLILRGGATTGGTDMLAKMVHQKLPFISTGMFLMIIDCVVVIFAAVCIGTTEALFALVCIFINGKVIDMVMLGLSKNKACFVMSDKWAEISHQVLHDMDRGATQLSARGAYSGKERPMLLCVLPPQEVARFKEIVRKEDDRAFMFITEAHEALGEGFDRLAEKD